MRQNGCAILEMNHHAWHTDLWNNEGSMHAPVRVRDSNDSTIRAAIGLSCLLAGIVWAGAVPFALADEDILAFAVVSEPPKDKARVPAKVAIDGTVVDLKLLASDHILSNLIWKKLEICHAMRLEGQKVTEGFRVTSVRVIDSAMLPMTLQGFAGDCLLRKALDLAPLVD